MFIPLSSCGVADKGGILINRLLALSGEYCDMVGGMICGQDVSVGFGGDGTTWISDRGGSGCLSDTGISISVKSESTGEVAVGLFDPEAWNKGELALAASIPDIHIILPNWWHSTRQGTHAKHLWEG
jgi:hypothetical protein